MQEEGLENEDRRPPTLFLPLLDRSVSPSFLLSDEEHSQQALGTLSHRQVSISATSSSSRSHRRCRRQALYPPSYGRDRLYTSFVSFTGIKCISSSWCELDKAQLLPVRAESCAGGRAYSKPNESEPENVRYFTQGYVLDR